MTENEIPPTADGDRGDTTNTQAAGQVRATNTTHGVGSCTPDQPVNMEPTWRYFYVTKERNPRFTEKQDPKYWGGTPASFEQLTMLTERDLVPALLCHASGLAVIDCDVSDTPDYVKQTDDSYTMSFHKGIDDLYRVANELGQNLTDLDTYSVLTKSGGTHLYFRQNPNLAVRSKPHRKGWLIDVKATENSWVVCPPTPEYSVIDDVPVKTLPLWLAQFIMGDLRNLPEKNPRPKKFPGLKTVGDKHGFNGDMSALPGYIETILQWVRDSNVNGCWNVTIHDAAHMLFRAGIELDEVIEMIVEAAEPRDDRERHAADRTVRSAWRGRERDDDWFTFDPEALEALVSTDGQEQPPQPESSGTVEPDAGSGPSDSGDPGTPQPPDDGNDEDEESDDEKPPVDVTGDVAIDAFRIRAVVSATNKGAPTVFKSSGRVVRVGKDDFNAAIISSHNQASFTEWLSQRVRWIKYTAKGLPVSTAPLDLAVKSVMSTIDTFDDVPVMQRISSIPFYSPSGKMVSTRGYDGESKAWYEPADRLTIPVVSQVPSEEELETATSLLRDELLVDFPFASTADRAGAFALILEPFVREMIDGNTPLHLIEAPTQGTGKSLLAEICAGVFLPPGKKVPTETLAREDIDVSKKITSILLEARPFIFYDNVSHFITSDSLAKALTSPTWSDRILGGNTAVDIPIRNTWLMTSNNASYDRDFPRRISLTRLDLSTTNEANDVVEKPETRTGFKHASIKEWAEENKGELIWAVLTIVNSWVARGRQPWSGRPLGSFENWSRVIGGILENIKIDGFLENRDRLVAGDDDDRDAEIDFVEMWWNHHGNEKIKPADLIVINELVGANVLGMKKDTTEKGASTNAGRWLKKARDRVIGDYVVRFAGSRQWMLVRREIA